MSGVIQNLSYILLGEDKSASTTLTKFQVNAEKVTGKVGAAFTKLGGVLGGEFGNVLSEVGQGVQELGEKGVSLSKSLAVGGTIAQAAGVGLMALGSAEQQAQSQLQTAIKNTGGSWDEYEKQIDAAIAKQENYGHSAIDTQNALQKLTQATNDPEEALKQMGVTANLAANQHITLTAAAGQVSKILNGSGTRTLTQYGITMEKVEDATKNTATANGRLQSAQTQLTNAQTRYTQLKEIDNAKSKLSLSQQFALANAADKVKQAQDRVAQSQQSLTAAQSSGVSKTEAGKDALVQLSDKLDGQADASMHSFSAQVEVVKTKLADWVDEVSGPVGGALTGLGTAAQVAGVGVEILRSRQAAHAAAALADSAATDVQTASTVAAVGATDAEAASMVGLDAAMDANPIGLVAGALGGLLAIIGGTALLGGMKKVTKSTTDYTQALEDDSEAIGDNTKALATNALLKDGALAAAQKLGISTALVVEATLGETGARKKLNDIIAAKTQKDNEAWTAQTKTHQQFVDATDAAKKNSAALGILGDAVGAESKAVKGTLANNKLYNSTLADLKTDADKGSISLKDLYKLIANPPSGKSTIVGPLVGMPSYLKAPKKPHAAGGRVAVGETSLVGEDGPEVAEFPAGTMIYPNNSKRASSGGGNITVVVNVQGSVHSVPSLAKAVQEVFEKGIPAGTISAKRIKTALGIAS